MKAIAKSLNAVIDEQLILFSKISPDRWSKKLAPDKWCAKEVLGHLIDSANNNTQRFVRATYEENFKIVYNQNTWVKSQYYCDANTAELIQLWLLLNKQIVRIIINFPEERQGVKADVGQHEVELLTIQEIAKSYVEHLLHHIDQIKRVTNFGN